MKKIIAADIEFNGQMGFYTVWANTQSGQDFILENVSFEEWQGSIMNGISLDDTRMAHNICDAAFDNGLSVVINGKRYIGNGRVAA
jgi:hypothetical protein